MKYGSSKLRIYDDRRSFAEGEAAVVENGSESFSDVRLSAAYVAKSQEAHVEFLPSIDQSRGDAALQRPATWLVQYRREIAPTRKRVERLFCDVHEIEDGKIARTRSYFDAATMLRQLGLAT